MIVGYAARGVVKVMPTGASAYGIIQGKQREV
jgi:hypothetical protein